MDGQTSWQECLTEVHVGLSHMRADYHGHVPSPFGAVFSPPGNADRLFSALYNMADTLSSDLGLPSAVQKAAGKLKTVGAIAKVGVVVNTRKHSRKDRTKPWAVLIPTNGPILHGGPIPHASRLVRRTYVVQQGTPNASDPTVTDKVTEEDALDLASAACKQWEDFLRDNHLLPP